MIGTKYRSRILFSFHSVLVQDDAVVLSHLGSILYTGRVIQDFSYKLVSSGWSCRSSSFLPGRPGWNYYTVAQSLGMEKYTESQYRPLQSLFGSSSESRLARPLVPLLKYENGASLCGHRSCGLFVLTVLWVMTWTHKNCER